jgi:hypothetical protein
MEDIHNFNNMFIELVSQLSTICPTSIIANNSNILRQIIRKDQKKVIDIFVQYVLKYKPQIDKGDETFFMNNTYSNECGADDSMINKVFEFKELWKQLSPDNRNVVIQYMQFLCQIALNYLNSMC